MANVAVQLIAISIISLERQNAHNYLTSRNTWKNNYDFIVIGGGTAGNVLAARLSEKPSMSVLLIEAGGPENVVSDMPANINLIVGSELNWHFVVENQTNFGRAYNRATLSAGKIMGGTSTIGLYSCNIFKNYNTLVP